MASGGCSQTRSARLAAAAIGLLAWAGLAIQFGALVNRLGSVTVALWDISRYFTILTNLAIAILFSALAFGWPARPRLVAGLALGIVLVGTVYAGLLRGTQDLSGADAVADILLHGATPILVPLFWAIFVPKGGLRPGDPWLWALYPLAYLAYALIRGASEGRYAYPFIDVAALGWGRALRNAGLIALGFIALGHAWIRLDRRLAAPTPPARS